MENIGIFYGHLEYFTAIWYILWPFGNVVVIWYLYIYFPILVNCVKKNLATLGWTLTRFRSRASTPLIEFLSGWISQKRPKDRLISFFAMKSVEIEVMKTR
jgi:hypothetical protein